jgi:predicted membrane protein
MWEKTRGQNQNFGEVDYTSKAYQGNDCQIGAEIGECMVG